MIAQVYTRDMYIETPVPNPQVPTLWPEAPPRAHRPSPFPPNLYNFNRGQETTGKRARLLLSTKPLVEMIIAKCG